MVTQNKVRFGIRTKPITGIAVILVVLSLVGLVPIGNQMSIRSPFDSLMLATDVGRNAYLTIAQDQDQLTAMTQKFRLKKVPGRSLDLGEGF